MPPVIVVGAGIGGLAAAVALAARGQSVLVIERDTAPGGKLRPVQVAGLWLDAGPTVLTLRHVFDSLFDLAGERLDDHLTLHPLRLLARHTWPDGTVLDLHADKAASADAIAAFAGPRAARQYLDFCRRSQQVFNTLDKTYLQAARPNPLSLALRCARGDGFAGVLGLARSAPFHSLWQALGGMFDDGRLRQLFARYATYGGSSPLQSPATLMLIAHVEQAGVWSVAGGLHQLASALAALARRLGVRFLLGRGVARVLVQQGGVSGVQLEPAPGGLRDRPDAEAESLPARAVVFNGDGAALAAGLLGPAVQRAVPRRPASARSLSALTWNLLTPVPGAALARHNVYFSADYPGEFDDLFKRRRLAHRPTVYVCAQDRDAGPMVPGLPTPTPPATAASAPPLPERLLCLVNAPARGDEAWPGDEEIAQCEARTFDHLKHLGLVLDPSSPGRQRHSPRDWAQRFAATGGALYGQATHGWRASFNRPAATTPVPGLFLAGGSTHPGAGLPMAALSGLLAADQVLRALHAGPTSTMPWRPGLMPGGTSTR